MSDFAIWAPGIMVLLVCLIFAVAKKNGGNDHHDED